MESGNELVLDDAARMLHFNHCEANLLSCPTCQTPAAMFDTPAAYPWAHRIFCGGCDENWLLCRLCMGKRQKKHLKVAKAINRHHNGCINKDEKNIREKRERNAPEANIQSEDPINSQPEEANFDDDQTHEEDDGFVPNNTIAEKDKVDVSYRYIPAFVLSHILLRAVLYFAT